ncbi:MAG: hypothetical protein SGCHY_005467 [Lobulomycetales sp.]
MSALSPENVARQVPVDDTVPVVAADPVAREPKVVADSGPVAGTQLTADAETSQLDDGSVSARTMHSVIPVLGLLVLVVCISVGCFCYKKKKRKQKDLEKLIFGRDSMDPTFSRYSTPKKEMYQEKRESKAYRGTNTRTMFRDTQVTETYLGQVDAQRSTVHSAFPRVSQSQFGSQESHHVETLSRQGTNFFSFMRPKSSHSNVWKANSVMPSNSQRGQSTLAPEKPVERKSYFTSLIQDLIRPKSALPKDDLGSASPPIPVYTSAGSDMYTLETDTDLQSSARNTMVTMRHSEIVCDPPSEEYRKSRVSRKSTRPVPIAPRRNDSYNSPILVEALLYQGSPLPTAVCDSPVSDHEISFNRESVIRPKENRSLSDPKSKRHGLRATFIPPPDIDFDKRYTVV